MATGNNATLEIEVISKGIAETAKGIRDIGNAAKTTDKKVTNLTASLGTLMTATTAAGSAFDKISSVFGEAGGAMRKLIEQTNMLLAITGALPAVVAELARQVDGETQATNRNTQAQKANIAAMSDAKAAARGLSGSLGVLWMTYGNMIPLAAGMAVGSAMKSIVTQGAEFEHALEAMRVRGDETIENINRIRDAAIEIGKGVYGPMEVAKAFDVLIMAGQSADQSLKSIAATMNLAIVGGTSIEKSATTLVQVGTALGYTSEGFDRVGDVIAKTAAVSMSSVESLSEAFKAGSAIGKLYGASLEDIGTSLGALANLGIQGSAAGTSLKNFYSELSKNSDKVKDTFAAMKMSQKDLKDENGYYLDLVQVVSKLSAGLDNLSASEQKVALSRLANERGMKTVVELLSMFRDRAEDGSLALIKFRESVGNSFGYTAIAAAQMALTTESQFKEVKNTLSGTFIQTFKDIEPEMVVFANKFKTLFASDQFKQTVSGIAQSLAGLALMLANNIDKIGLFIEAFVAFKTVSFASGIIMSVVTALVEMEKAFVAGGLAAKAFQVSLGLLGGVLLAVGAAWVWYQQMKDNAIPAKEDAALGSIAEMNKKLEEQKDRIEKVNAELKKTGDINKANQAVEQDHAMDKAIEEQKAALKAAQERVELAKKQARDGSGGMFNLDGGGTLGIGPSHTDAAVKAAEDNLKRVEKESADGIEAIKKNIVGVRAAAEEQARLQDEIIKKKQKSFQGDGFGTGTVEKADTSEIDKAMKKEQDQFLQRMEHIAVSKAADEQAIAAMKQYGTEYSKITAGERELIKLQYERSHIDDRIPAAAKSARQKFLDAEIAKTREWIGVEKEKKTLQDQVDAEAAAEKATQDEIDSTIKATEAVKLKVETFGMEKGAIEALALAQNEAKLADLEAFGITGKRIDQLKDLIAQQRELANQKGQLGALEANRDALKEMDKYLESNKFLDFANDFKGAFGVIGKAIDAGAKSFDKFNKKQEQLKKLQGDSKGIKDIKVREKAEELYRNEALKNEVDMYADMASAAKGFFSEKTAAYKIFNALEQGMRIAELVLAYESFTIKKGLMLAEAATKEATTDAGIVQDVKSATSTVATATVEAGAGMMAGAGKIFGQLGIYGFIGVAAMVALMASLGFSGGSSVSAPSISEQRQKTQGTGSVLGDENAKSNSASKALDGLKNNADVSLKYSSQMLMALRNIEDGISGMAAAVAQTSGLRTTAADELAAGTGSSSGFLGFSSSSKEIQDSGILFGGNQTVAGVRASGRLNAQGYQDIHSESSSWWGLSSDSSDEEKLKQLDDSLQRQMGLTVNHFVDGLAAAGEALGKSGEDIKASLQNFGIDLGHLSLKGLSGDDLQKQIEAVFSKMGDDMATQVLPQFKDFQKVGEGYFETVVRVANGYEKAKVSLERLGVAVVSLSSISDKQGDVATEAVRESLMKAEGYQHVSSFFNVTFQNFFHKMSGIGDIIQNMDGSADDLIAAYKQLIDIRDQMKASGLSDDVTQSMVAGAGSIDALATGLSNYLKLLPQEKQSQVAQAKVTAEFARLGQTLPKNKQALADLIDTYMAGDDASKQYAASLMNLAGDYNDMYDTLQSNVSDAQSNLKTAYDDQKSSIDDLISKFQDYAKAMRDFGKSLLTGSDSPLTLAQKYAELQNEYQNNLSLARMGDADAIGKFQDLANQMLQTSKEYNASGDAYTADFNSVLQDSKYLAQVADGQVSVAQQQLDAMNKQVGSLITINDSVLTVADAITSLKAAMVAAGMAVDGSHADGLSYVPFDGYKAELHEGERVLTKSENAAYMSGSLGGGNANAAMVSELQALRQEVAQLRQDQAQQTGAIIGGIYDSNERNADAIVEGTGDAISKSDWKDNKVELV